MPERSQAQVQLPVVGKKYLDSATDLYEGGLNLFTLEKPLPADKITPYQIEKEAKHLAALPEKERAKVLFTLLNELIEAIAMGREVSAHLLWIAESLQNTAHQLDVLAQSGYDSLRRHVDRPDSPSSN